MSIDDYFIDNLPTLDLHGEIRQSARVLVKEFINDNYVLENKKIVIIHGVGTGALRKEVNDILKKDKRVESFKVIGYNPGCTLVYLKKNC